MRCCSCGARCTSWMPYGAVLDVTRVAAIVGLGRAVAHAARSRAPCRWPRRAHRRLGRFAIEWYIGPKMPATRSMTTSMLVRWPKNRPSTSSAFLYASVGLVELTGTVRSSVQGRSLDVGVDGERAGDGQAAHARRARGLEHVEVARGVGLGIRRRARRPQALARPGRRRPRACASG